VSGGCQAPTWAGPGMRREGGEGKGHAGRGGWASRPKNRARGKKRENPFLFIFQIF
jgi:hypothetical protein